MQPFASPMQKDLISVIIPVYNVEAYIRRCLDSVLVQSYANLDIILINDASPDGCRAICDEYAEKDDRVCVIHKPINQGLGMARNTGLEHSKGEYVSFVDSDDWIHPEMFQDMMGVLEQHSADIVQCKYAMTYDKHIRSPKDSGTVAIFDNIAALKSLLMTRQINTTACGKIYKRSLFEHIRFSDTRFNEDLEIIYKVIYKAKKVVFIDKSLYYYFQRSSSLVHEKMTLERAEFMIRANKERIGFVKENCPELLIASRLKLLRRLVVIFCSLKIIDTCILIKYLRNWK